MLITGKTVNGVLCYVYIHNGVHYAIAINGNGLVATW